MSIKLKKVIYSSIPITSYSGSTRFKTGIIPESVRLQQAAYPGLYGFGPYGNPALNSYLASVPFGGFAALRSSSSDVQTWFPPYSWANSYSNLHLLYKEVDEAHAGTVITTSRSIQYLEVQNSSNTPGWPGPKGTRVGGLVLAKSKPPIKRPKEPVYFKPKLLSTRKPIQWSPVELSMIPPSRKNGEGLSIYLTRLDRWSSRKARKEARLTLLAERKYYRQLEKYEVNLAINLKRIASSKANYQKALDNYAIRMLKYDELVRKSQDLTYKRAPIHPVDIPVDNPYGLIKMTFRKVPVFYRVEGTDAEYNTAENINIANYYALSPSEQYNLYNVYFAFLKTTALTKDSSPSDLAQYGESIRNLILNTIDPYLTVQDEKLRRKIHQKLKNQTVHIGNIIAERKQTMDLVQSTVKRILQLIKAKKNIFKAAASYAKNAKQIANDILAFKFGVEPLMNDIQSFAKYLDNGSDEPIITVRTNTGKSSNLYMKIETSSFTFDGFVEISYTVKCVVDNPASRALSEFGLINPLEILWEVTPWSFVIDWFLPVGDWISNKTSDCGLVFKTGTRKVRLVGSFTTSESQSGLPLDPLEASGTSSILVDFDGEVVGRTVLTDIPNLPPIRLKNPLSWSHGVESVALLVQKLKIR